MRERKPQTSRTHKKHPNMHLSMEFLDANFNCFQGAIPKLWQPVTRQNSNPHRLGFWYKALIWRAKLLKCHYYPKKYYL